MYRSVEWNGNPKLHPDWDASLTGCKGGGAIIFSTERGIPMECRYPNICTILFDFAALFAGCVTLL